MRPIFNKPTNSELLLPASLEELKRVKFNVLSAASLQSIAASIDLFEAYRQFHFGMNPTIHAQFKTAPEETQAWLHKLRKNADQYIWRFETAQLFNQDNFWLQYATEYPEGKQEWEFLSPYAYYSSEELYDVSATILPQLQAYCDAIQTERSKKDKGRRTSSYKKASKCLEQYRSDLEKKIQEERRRIAQAMLARLELIANNGDFSADDVLLSLSDRLNTPQIDLSSTIGVPPYYTELRQHLKPETFYYFHHFIMQYGDTTHRDRIQNLLWVKEGYYSYNEKKSRWVAGKHIIAGKKMKVPTSKWWPNWLFKGHNTRVKAFGDVTRILKVQMAKERAVALQNKMASTQNLSAKDIAVLRRDFSETKEELVRIQKLKVGLVPELHGMARDTLQAYLGEILENAESIVTTQMQVLQNSQKDLPKNIDQNTFLDPLFQLANHLQEEVALFSEFPKVQMGYDNQPLKEQVDRAIQTFRNTLANEKVQHWIQALAHQTFDQHPQYDEQGQLLYWVSDRESVGAFFKNYGPYVLPKQQEALQKIQAAIEGNYIHPDGSALRYSELYEAARMLDDQNPEKNILQPVFERFIAPSIVASRSPGYALLREYKEAHPEAPTTSSTLLQPMQKEEETAKQLENYRGEDEDLWESFSLQPQSIALSYAQKRLVHLLEAGNIDDIENSACLHTMHNAIANSSSVQEKLMSSLDTVTTTDKNLEAIDALVERFTDDELRQFWKVRREDYLKDRLLNIMKGSALETAPDLQSTLERHPEWGFSQATQKYLSSHIRKLSLEKGWVEAQHTVFNATPDLEVRYLYYLKLLKCVLHDSAFAKQYKAHLPQALDERFKLMCTPEFVEICKEAMQCFDKQQYIDNLDALKILQSFLQTGGLATVLDLKDLIQQCDALRTKFKNQLDPNILEKDIIASMVDIENKNLVQNKIALLMNFHDHYQSTGNTDEQSRVAESLKKIQDVIKQHWRQEKITHEEATELLQPMTGLEAAEPLLWRLNRHERLSTLAVILEGEIYALEWGEGPTFLPSLLLLYEAMERQVLDFTERDCERILVAIERVEKHFSSQLSSLNKKYLSDLDECLKNLLTKDGNDNSNVIKEQLRCLQQLKIEASKPDGDAKVEDLGKPVTFSFNDKSEIGQRVINNLQIRDTLRFNASKDSEEVLCEVFSGTDEKRKTQVHQDLLSYFVEAYRIIIDKKNYEKPQRLQVRSQLNKLHSLIKRIKLSESYPITLVVGNYNSFDRNLIDFKYALKDLIIGARKEYPELNELVFWYIKLNFLSDEVRQQWERDLKYLTNTVSEPRLEKAIAAFLNVLNKSDTDADLEAIKAYVRYCCKEPEPISFRNTSQVRLMPLPPLPPSSKGTIQEEGISQTTISYTQ